MIDVETLLKEVSPEAPGGEHLEYDPEYLELQRLAQGTPEQQVGDSIVPAEDPDWREVARRGPALMGRTKDLRLALLIALAELKAAGFPGLCEGLALVRGLIDRLWNDFHPQLDPDDQLDPTERVNILASLAPPPGSFQDPLAFPRHIREAPLTASRQLGCFSVRDILVAGGALAAPESGDSPPEMSVIEAAFQDTDLDELRGIVDAIRASREHARAIEDAMTERVGVDKAMSLETLHDALTEVAKHAEEHLARCAPEEAAPEETSAGSDAPGAGATGPAGAAPSNRLSGEIHSREEVLAALGKITSYYERYEPSSPVPLLVNRAKKLVNSSFLDVIQDVSPEVLEQVRKLGGVDSGGE